MLLDELSEKHLVDNTIFSLMERCGSRRPAIVTDSDSNPKHRKIVTASNVDLKK